MAFMGARVLRAIFAVGLVSIIYFSLRSPYRHLEVENPLPTDTAAPPKDGPSATETPLQASAPPLIRQASMLSGELLLNEWYQRSMATHVEHGEKWGFPINVLERNIVGYGNWFESIFSKELHVLRLLIHELNKAQDERAQWIVFFDADTIILNPNISWEIFLPPADFSNINFISSKDWNGLNCGIFFVRVTDWSVNMMTDIISLPRSHPEIDLSFLPDQNAMKYLLPRNGYREHVLYQPRRWHNAFPYEDDSGLAVQPGDLLVHFAAMKEGAPEAMESHFGKVEQSPEKWHVSLANSTYPTEIKAFWERLRGARSLLQNATGFLHQYEEPEKSPRVELSLLSSAVKELEIFLVENVHLEATFSKCVESVSEKLRKAENANITAEPKTTAVVETTTPVVDLRSED